MINWKYIYSKKLGQKVAFSDDVDYIYTEDKTKYTKKELDILRKSGGITKEVHELKKTFMGEITELTIKELEK